MNYATSTQERIADVNAGMRVETGTLDNTAYLIQNVKSLFSVHGRIKVLALFGEAITQFSAHGTLLKYFFTSTTPVIAQADLSAVSGALTSLAQGARITCTGTTVGTAAAITASAGISYAPVAPLIVGTVEGVGVIGIETTTASQASGTSKFTLLYVPLSDGAYAEAIV